MQFIQSLFGGSSDTVQPPKLSGSNPRLRRLPVAVAVAASPARAAASAVSEAAVLRVISQLESNGFGVWTPSGKRQLCARLVCPLASFFNVILRTPRRHSH